MLRRRGSAPAVVLQQHFSETRGILLKTDRIIPPPDGQPKLLKTKRGGRKDYERGCSPPPPLSLISANDLNQSFDYDSPSPKCPSPVSPGSPILNKKPAKNRPKRRDSCSEPFIGQASNPVSNTKNASTSLQRRSSSFRDYNIVLLGQGGVGKSGSFIKVRWSLKLFKKMH